jgi:hypothetical protein
MGVQAAAAGLSAISATPLPPAANGARYFPVILTVTSGNRRIQDLVEPMASAVSLPLLKTLPRGNYRKI